MQNLIDSIKESRPLWKRSRRIFLPVPAFRSLRLFMLLFPAAMSTLSCGGQMLLTEHLRNVIFTNIPDDDMNRATTRYLVTDSGLVMAYWTDTLPGLVFIKEGSGQKPSVRTISMATKGLPEPGYLEFLVHNQDTLFLFPGYTTSILMANQSGQIYRTLDLSQADGPGTKVAPVATHLYPMHYRFPYMYIMLFTKRTIQLEDGTTTYDYSRFPASRIDLRQDSLAKAGELPLDWPDIYGTHGNDYIDYYPMTENGPDGSILYSFRYHPMIQEVKDGKRTRTIQCTGKKFKIPPKFVTSDSLRFSMQRHKKYSFESCSYGPLKYDAYNQLYYRSYTVGKPYVAENDLFPLSEDRPWYLMVMDSSFKVLDEIEMDPQQYLSKVIAVTPDGFLLQKRGNQTDGTMKLALFRISNLR